MSETRTPAGWRTIGHDGASRFLLRAIEAGRLAHAYLFTGPPRVGKMRLAIDLARAVNCEVPSAAPCGECRHCRRIERGVHADVRIINVHTPTRGVVPGPRGADPSTDKEDAARAVITIGHIRELQHDASLEPFEGSRKVFIIEDAERMNVEAGNCLLKTLEEPPAKVLLVLTAASPGALPETVLSRCQRVDLRRVPVAAIERGLIDRGGAAPRRAAALARLARGQPGWAFAALADPAALDRRRQGVLRVLTALTGDLEERFRYARELSASFRRNRDAVTAELDLWVEWWRDALLVKHGLREDVANADAVETLEALAAQTTATVIASTIEAVQRTRQALEANANARLAFEVLMLDAPRYDAASIPEPAALDGVASRDAAGRGSEETDA